MADAQSECGAPDVPGAVARVPGTVRGSRKAAWLSCPPRHDPRGTLEVWCLASRTPASGPGSLNTFQDPPP